VSGTKITPDVARALGPEPLDDARHLLPPLPGSSAAATATGLEETEPPEATAFVVDLRGALPLAAERVREAFTPEVRARLGHPAVWVRPQGRDRWALLDSAADTDAARRFEGVALAWDLSGMLSEGVELARELGALAAGASEGAARLGRIASPRDTPEQAAERAARLLDLRARFGRSVELRLMPTGRPFPARQVWRAAYALGLEWGDLDLFHWRDPLPPRRRLFTLSAVGLPGYFLPERAAHGEGVHGVALGFDLPYSPDPVGVFDRAAVALTYLRQALGGRATSRDGRDLDADALADERDALTDAVAEMNRLGLAPGSAAALRLF
jgi:cell division protein ZipA